MNGTDRDDTKPDYKTNTALLTMVLADIANASVMLSRAATRLDGSSTPCRCCSRVTWNSVTEYRLRGELDAITRKLDRYAEHINRHLTEAK